jgi:DNA mismatch endonuclease (patch repair protein)
MKLVPPPATSAAATLVMRGNRKTGTRPERRLRSYLHSRGLRFRVNYSVQAHGFDVKADIAFPRAEVVVMVDGCFWHVCPLHGTRPTSNRGYWDAKLARNVDRDRRVDAGLAEAGWTLVRIWEHTTLEDAASRVDAALSKRGLASN